MIPIGSLRIVFVLSLVFANLGLAHNPAQSKKGDNFVLEIIVIDDSKSDLDVDISLEEHSLYELLASDPAKNLAVLHPAIVMGAFQRAKSWLFSTPPRLIPNPEYYAGKIRIFPVMSSGMPGVTDKRIISNFSQIETFADFLTRGADRDGSAKKTPIFSGPPGTGKTEFLTIMLEKSGYLQTMLPDYFNYTYEWKDLGKIPALIPFLNIYEAQGEK